MLKKKKKLEAAIGYVLKEKVFLEILQNSQEEICTRASFSKKKRDSGTGVRASFLKKRLWHRCFPVNFAKFLRTPFSRTPPGD